MSYPILTPGSTGDYVSTLQTALNAPIVGIAANPQLTVDGIFGTSTETALLAWQASVFVDGQTDAVDWVGLGNPAVIFPPGPPPPPVITPPVTSKVTRSGTQLMQSGNPYRMIGFDIWPTAVATWNVPANRYPIFLNDGSNLSNWLGHIRASAPHVNTIRTWFFQQFAMDKTQGGARNWAALDKVLNVADSNGFQIIASLEDNWSYERQGSQQPALSSSWFNGGYRSTVLPHEGITYRAWVQEVVTRYAGDERIVLWEPGNEMNGMTTAFLSDISTLIKSIDPAALVGTGGVGDNTAFITLPNVDMGSYHYYTNYRQTNWQNDQALCAAAGKPWYMGEMGSSSTGTTRAKEVSTLMSSVFQLTNTAGFIYWQYSDGGGDQFVVKSGDPVLAVVDGFVL